jgi:hypothetical protein
MVRDPWSNCRLTAEHDHRVREARLGYERVERLLVMRLDREPWFVRLARLFSAGVSGAGRQRDGQSGLRREAHQQNVVVAMVAARATPMKPTTPASQADYWRRAA